ncbi:Uncharacterised protein [Legionella busanensis]|uniref:Apea-like HEPN domain-containing protein n=1 Tax=Legionella busanensis TaxID=190655 RepID=A0A378KHP2_9GAMM|nr:HEPN domain-containing protein [Legionella busanensis]STX81304.1 Uncharacterised protein [Legionella busanensis]
MSNKNLTCNKITILLAKPRIGTCYIQPITNTFNYVDNNVNYAVNINFINFDIEVIITTSKLVNIDTLRDNFLSLYEIKMLFLRYFPNIQKIEVSNTIDSHYDDELEKKSTQLYENFLVAYSSYGDLKKNCACLIDIATFNYDQIFPKWIPFKNNYDFPYRMYLYTTSTMEFLIDLRLALLSQVFEPLFKAFLIREKPQNFKEVIQETILLKGTSIFKKQINEVTLIPMIDKIKTNRNQLFHVEKKKNIPNGSECLYIFHKLNLLYRYCLLELLEVDLSTYSSRLENFITTIETSFDDCS